MSLRSGLGVLVKLVLVAITGVLLFLLVEWVREVDRRMFGSVAVERVQGQDRYQTAVRLSERRFPDAPDGGTVYVTSGTSFADALFAGPLVADDDSASLLPVAKDGVPEEVADELRRLAPDSVVIVGGTGVVSAGVEQALGELAGGVTRLAGGDRFATAVRLSQERFPEPEPQQVTVYVASGTSFADALFTGPVVAALDDTALLPVGEQSLPGVVAEELRRLQPQRIVIVGGLGVVSKQTEEQLRSLTGVVTRLAGANRFATAVMLSQQHFPGSPDDDVTAYLVSATAFADALFAGPVVASLDAATMLPVTADDVPVEVVGELSRLDPGSMVVVGGENAVSERTEQQLRDG